MSKPTIAAIIVGIEGFEKYTKPLIDSIAQHEPECRMVVIDNASSVPYPPVRAVAKDDLHFKEAPYYILVRSIERACYSRAINEGAIIASALEKPDWYIVLSNDVLCTGPFADTLAQYDGSDLVGPLLKEIQIERVGNVPYLEGWAVFVPRRIWDDIGGWDDGMRISSYEDVEYSHRARVNGYGLVEDKTLPFVHLDQKQRFYLVPDYWSSEHHNRARFVEKYGASQ